MNDHDTIRDAHLAQLRTAVPSVKVVSDLNQAELLQLADQASGLVLNLFLDRITYDPNNELGAVHQGETWSWSLELLLPTSQGGTGIAYELFNDIRDALCPQVGGFRPTEQCDVVNLSQFENSGELGRSRVYTATITHERFAG